MRSFAAFTWSALPGCYSRLFFFFPKYSSGCCCNIRHCAFTTTNKSLYLLRFVTQSLHHVFCSNSQLVAVTQLTSILSRLPFLSTKVEALNLQLTSFFLNGLLNSLKINSFIKNRTWKNDLVYTQIGEEILTVFVVFKFICSSETSI